MRLTLLEIAFAALVVLGISFWSIPAALIVAGVAGVVACEIAGRNREDTESPR